MEVVLVNNNTQGVQQIRSAVEKIETPVDFYHSSSFDGAIKHMFKNPWQRTIVFLEDTIHGATVDFLKTVQQSKLLTTIVLLANATISPRQLDDYNELGVECIIDKRIFKKRLEKTLKIIVTSVTPASDQIRY